MSTNPDVFDPSVEPEPEAAPPARPSNGRRRRRKTLLAAGAAAVMLLGTAGVLTAMAHKSVEIQIDGVATTVTTFAGSVDGVLEQEGIEVGEHDLLVPGREAALRDGSQVVLRTADEVTFLIDGADTTVWTIGDTAAEALADVGTSGRDVSLTASRSEGRHALSLPVTAGGPVAIAVDGETQTVEIPGVADLDGVLLRAEVTLNPADQVEVTVAEDGIPLVSITRVSTGTSTRTESIDFETVERGTADLYVGQSRVVSEGAQGELTYTDLNRVVDGEVVSSKLRSVEVTREPQDRVVEVGTAQRPAPQPTTTSSGSSGSGSSGSGSSGSSSSGSGSSSSGSDSGGGGSVSGDVWAALAQCESGGNPTIVSSNGLYYGLYQFSLSTWRSVGGTGLPSEASPAEQTQRAQALQARSGWGQWPHCSSVLGLR